MPTKIRLQRKGKKGQPFYHIVIADGRAPRDGRFIEKIGTYNPLVKPAAIEIDFDSALGWLQKGAQPTDTARAILSYKGVLYKNHLLKGVQKGALTSEEAEAKFLEWKNRKEESIMNAVKQQDLEKKAGKKKALEQEMKVNEAIASRVAEKRAAQFTAEKQAEVEGEVEEVTDAMAEAETEAIAEAEADVETVSEVEVEPLAEDEAEAESKTEVEAEAEENTETKSDEITGEAPAAEEEAAEEEKAE